MHSLLYDAPRPAAYEELEVRKVYTGWNFGTNQLSKDFT